MNVSFTEVLKIEKNKLIRKCPECQTRGDKELSQNCRRGCAKIFDKYYEYSKANIARELWNLGIGDFNLSIGTEKVRESRTNAVKTVRLYLDNIDKAYDKGFGMVLYGGHGSGKSMLAACVMKQAIAIGKTAKMLDFSEMTNIIRRSRFEKDQIEPLEKELNEKDFYCIENFGVNQFLIRPKDISDDKDKNKDINRFIRGSDIITSEISRLLEIRHKIGFPTIITTYYEIEQLYDAQNEDAQKIIGALFGKFNRLKLEGDNYRKEDNDIWEKNLVAD